MSQLLDVVVQDRRELWSRLWKHKCKDYRCGYLIMKERGDSYKATATRRLELLEEIKNWIDSDSEIRKYMVPEELYNDLVCELDKEVTA